MSDHVIIVVPADPHFVPAKAAQRYAAELVRAAFPDADDITSEVEEHVAFRDCGESLDSIACPSCGASLPGETWGELMNADYSEERGFQLALLPMPCCGHETTLNDLHYDMPQAFSRYALTATNPAVAPTSAATAATPSTPARR